MIKTTANVLEVGSKLASIYITEQIHGFQGKHCSIIRNHTHIPSCPSMYQVRKFAIDPSTQKGINITHFESNGIK